MVVKFKRPTHSRTEETINTSVELRPYIITINIIAVLLYYLDEKSIDLMAVNNDQYYLAIMILL